MKANSPTDKKDQSARFREAAKKAEAGDAKEFERAFNKVVRAKKGPKAFRP
jgi:hypothetical protein